MKLNETKEKRLSVTEAAVSAAKNNVSFMEENMDSLNADAGSEAPESDRISDVNPAIFMNGTEKLEWNRLTSQEQQEFIQRGICQTGYLSVRNERKAVGQLKRGWWIQEDEEELYGEFCKDAVYKAQEKDRKIKDGRMQDPPSAHHTDGENLLPDGSKAGEKMNGYFTGKMPVENGRGNVHKSRPEAAASNAQTAALAAAKEAASEFRKSLEARSSAQDYQAGKQLADETPEGSGNTDSMSPALGIGAKIAGTFTAVAAAVAQAALSLISSLFSSVLSIIATIASSALLIITVVLMVVSIVTNSSSGGIGASGLVATALAESGNTDGSKYWKFTTGREFVNGDETPWCACFVSWCAEQNGLIDSGLFPRSASVAAYRNFFKQKNQYVEAGGYTPKAGDLIVFGADEHIGIVQYSEGDRVVTIEGNTSDMVHERSYHLGSRYITGYCTPDYPEADFSGNSNAEIAYHFLRSQGLTREAAVAVLGNLKQESGIDPNQCQSGGPGRGICQWEEGGRFEDLKSFAEIKGKQWNSLEVQLEFMWQEFIGGEATCAFILNRDYGGLENFKRATDIAWAVEAFEKSFERAGNPMMERRIQYAYEFYEQFQE